MAADFLSGDDPSQLPGQQLNPPPAVGGDMTKAVYDPNNDGKVSSAESADNAGHANTADEAVAVSGVNSAGVSHYYGTDSSGNPGFHSLPTGGGGGGGGGSGEANTSSNVGTGVQLAKPKAGVDLPFRTLKPGANITLTQSTNEILIEASGGGGSALELAGKDTDGDPFVEAATQAIDFHTDQFNVDGDLAGGVSVSLRQSFIDSLGGGGGTPTALSICLLSARATGQTFTYVASTARQLTLGTEIIDAANVYNTSTGRYTPNVAGYYAVYGVVQGPTNTVASVALIYKNGVGVATGTYSNSATAGQRMDVYTIVQMNGTTDYLELWGFSTSAGNTASSDGNFTQLYAYLIAT